MVANPILPNILDMSLEILIQPHELFYAKHYTTSSKNLVVTITTVNVYCILEEIRIVYFPLGHSKNILMHPIFLTL